MVQNGCLAYHLGMPGTLIVLRHGQSTWNELNLFTGWHDVPLSPRGENEADAAGRTLRDAGLRFDSVYTSLLTRAIDTNRRALAQLGQPAVGVVQDWRLNERHYGALQGLNKSETAKQFGEEQVLVWRRSFDTPPPSLEADDPRSERSDSRYKRLKPEDVPLTECLKDTVARVLPFWDDAMAPAIRAGKRIVVAAHGNSIRALVKHLDTISDDDIVGVNIPNGIPLVYTLDSDLKPISKRYLGDESAALAASAAIASQGKA